MSQFIRIGSRIINLDRVHSIELLPTSVILTIDHVPADGYRGIGRALELRGEEADAFRRLLAEMTERVDGSGYTPRFGVLDVTPAGSGPSAG